MKIDINKIQSQARKSSSTGEDKKGAFGWLQKDIKLFGNNLNDKKKERFYSQLSILLSSGIDIKTAFEIVVDEQNKEADKLLFSNINERILKGDSLSEALQSTGRFSPYEYYCLKIGEESGKVSQILETLATYYNKKIKLQRQMMSAFSYPILVLCTAVAAVIFMMNFMVPMFADVYKRFGGELPALTRTIVSISDFFTHYIALILLIIVSFIVFIISQRKTEWFRQTASRIALATPMAKDIIKLIYVERFCQAMSLLTEARTPMLRALGLVKNMIGFYPFEKAMAEIEHDILHGKSLHESMQKFPFFERKMISLIKVGEEVNKLDTIFEKLNDQYSDELEHKLSMVSSMLEPIMIIFIGALVAVILIAMYLPMFKLGSSVY